MLGRLGGAMIGSGRLTMRGAGSRTGAIRPAAEPRGFDRRARLDSAPCLVVVSASRRPPASRPFGACSRESFPEADFFGTGAAFLVVAFFCAGAAFFLPAVAFFGGGADRRAAAFFSVFF